VYVDIADLPQFATTSIILLQYTTK